MRKLLILTEAGDGIGYGHYTRCHSIYSEVLERKNSATLLVFQQGENAMVSDPTVQILDWQSNLNSLAPYAETHDVLIDSYMLQQGSFAVIRQIFERVIVLDDYNRLPYLADILVNPNVYFNQVDYGSQKTARCFGGKDFVILRKAFRADIVTTPVKAKIAKVVITLGGSDVHNLLPVLCEMLTSIDGLQITVICPNSNVSSRLANQFPSLKCRYNLPAQDMFEEFMVSDVVVSGCGQTLHELASIGKPTIGICVGEDQRMNQGFYLEQGWLQSKISWNDTDLARKLEENLTKFKSETLRRRVSELGPTLININGVRYLVDLLQREKNFSYRTASVEDCNLYFEWANDADVRNNAINRALIPWSDHKKWFSERVNNERSLMILFFLGESPVGQIRVDWEGAIGWIDYSVDRSYRGAGLGSLMLTELTKMISHLPEKPTIYGTVRSDNKSSARAFQKAGFIVHAFKRKNDEDFLTFQY